MAGTSKDGDADGTALARLLAARGTVLKGYAYLLCGDASLAEDLVQEALVRALGTRRARSVEHLESYVRKAILNLVMDGTRRRTRWLRVRPLFVMPTEPTGDEGSNAAVRLTVRDALLGLSPRQRACVVLRYYEDRSVTQIAEELGCGEGTVKRHLHDARRTLADLLRELDTTAEKVGHGA
ncbi:sigma-70 family RNA polymerase sigma factor [Embleya sp. NPDC059237]|uniref:sigma-70 family RNA polymerase sigma factor n=1 Tax=Embleya sp. NPDC059237 TaxID=3346784 RepID=UPI0036747D78